MSASSVKWVRLGDYIEEYNVLNSDNYIKEVRSVSTIKDFKPTGAKVDKSELRKYKVVPSRYISYVQTTKNERCFACAINLSNKDLVVTSVNKVITSKDERVLNNEYLFLLLRRESFDRYAIFNSWGSAREVFQYEDLCNVKIPLPSIEVQNELVATYNGLKSLAEQNEALIEPLTKACEAFIVHCLDKYTVCEIGDYIDIYHEKNTDCAITLEQGINIDKIFITPQRSNSDLSSRIIVRKGQFAYCTQLNNENVAIAYREEEDCVVSPVYNTFEIKKSMGNKLLPKYLFLWLKRREFGRYVYWKSVGSAYEFLQQENLCEYKIPIPPIEVQQSIVNLYTCLEEAKKIASEAREQLKTLCPALVQKAANS